MHLQFIWLRALSACSVLMFPVAAFATSIDGNNINDDAIWLKANNPYVITTQSVTRSVPLTIEPGVRVEFAGAFTLRFANTLIAKGTISEPKGTISEPITFAPNGTATIAASLEFSDGDAVFGPAGYVSGSILEHVVVENIGGSNTNGAVVLNGAHPYIHNSIIRNNGTSGIYAYNIDGDLRIEDNLIEGNNGVLGGGLFIATMPGGRVLLRGNTVSNNTVTESGGGLFLTVDGLAANLTANTFSNNQATVAGGMYLTGNPYSVNSIALSGNTTRDNTAVGKGGGIYAINVGLTLTSETVRGNVAEGYDNNGGNGGGLLLEMSPATISKSMILGNRSKYNGGGIYLGGGTYSITDSVLAMNESELAHGGGIDIHHLPQVTFDHSVIAGNKARDYGAGISMTDGRCTLINSAVVLNESANAIAVYVDATLQGNTIAYNSAGPQSVFLASTIGVGAKADKTLAINDNNIFRNANSAPSYDIVTFRPGISATDEAIIDARDNWWGPANEAPVANRIKIGDAVLWAAIDTSSPKSGPSLSAPISPPNNVTSVATSTSVTLSWSANPESDVKGYRVYWGSKPAPDFEGFYDVDNVTTVTSDDFPKLTASFVAVTAYDDSETGDDSTTPVNENQTQGHESWYAVPSSTIAMEAVSANAAHLTNGDLVAFSITVTNTGLSVGSGEFTVTHTISPGLSYYYINGQISLPQKPKDNELTCSLSLINDKQVTCTHAPIAANTSVDINIATLVITPDMTDVVSTATVRPFNSADAAYNQAQVTLRVNAPDVAVSWSSVPAAQVNLGDSVEYTVKVVNNGRVAAPGTKLAVTIPAAFTVNALDARCTPATESAPLSCKLDIDGLGVDSAGKPKQSVVSITFKLTANVPGAVVLAATVTTANDSNASNNQASVVTTIVDPLQGNVDAGADVDSSGSGNKKKGGGVLGLEWLLMFAPLLAARRRFRFFAAVT